MGKIGEVHEEGQKKERGKEGRKERKDIRKEVKKDGKGICEVTEEGKKKEV